MAGGIVLTRPVRKPVTGGSGIAGMAVSVINGQPMITLEDTTRANKVLSVSEQVLVFAENRLTHLDWIQIAGLSDADSGYVADFDGSITSITAHCENATSDKDVVLYIDGTRIGSLGTLSGGQNVTINDPALNIDFLQGQRLRLRAEDGTTGQIEDTVVKLTVKWRLV